MRSMRLGSLAILAALTPACGGDSTPGSSGPAPIDISGMYQVDHHTMSAGDCVNEGTVITSLGTFRVIATTHGYAALRCTGTDVSTCPADLLSAATSDLLAMVDEPADGGWTGTSASSLFVSDCVLSYDSSSALLGDVGLRIEDRSYVEHATLDRSACTMAEALSRGASMPCRSFRVLVGTQQ